MKRTITLRLDAEEYEQVAFAADLNGLTVREYVVRAINQRLCSQGVDAVLLSENIVPLTVAAPQEDK